MSTLDQVKVHPFFRGVDWLNLRERKAPFIPALDSEIDAGYFDDVNSASLPRVHPGGLSVVQTGSARVNSAS